jgi:hypothetical protein
VEILPGEILEEAAVLFEDVRVGEIEPERHAAFVIGRVLERGTMRSVAALMRYYGRGRIVAFFREEGRASVSPRTRSLWARHLELSEEECTRRSSPRIRSPFWVD